MSTPTAFEQFTLELINQARLNPHGEFARLVTNAPANVQGALSAFSVDLTLLASQFAALTPVAPVAWNSALGDAAQTHTDLMLAKNEQSHQLPGEAGLVARIQAAGYANLSAVGEDVFAFADDAFFAHAGFFIDWGNAPGGIQNPPGHRNNIMSSNFTEVGVGHVAGTGSGPGSPVGPNLVTHDFGNRFDYTSQVTGVIFNDADGNAFYGMGEGVGGATISSGGTTTNGFSTGGYNLDLVAGTHELVFSSSLGTANITVALGAENIKVDMFDPGSFRSSASATLGAGGVALQLLGEQAINATGNTGNNTLTGNITGNALDGGRGADRMEGGAGNDTYKVDNAGDTVIEKAGEGTDLVKSSVAFTLGANIEKLTLTGSGDIAGTGNGLNNTIVGNAGANTLNGGAGADRMDGGAGNDTYVVDVATDKVIEAAGQGTDLVKSSVAFNLGAQDIERLTLTGSGDIAGTGNGLDNTIVGNAGRNTLKGDDGNDKLSGGKGNDTLVGGDGRDTFIFDTALSASANLDRVTDYSVADDTIQLENSVFTGLIAGTLQAAAFFIGSAAHDSNDRIIYNAANGTLLFDADGQGGAAGVKFATLGTGLALTASEFRVV